MLERRGLVAEVAEADRVVPGGNTVSYVLLRASSTHQTVSLRFRAAAAVVILTHYGFIAECFLTVVWVGHRVTHITRVVEHCRGAPYQNNCTDELSKDLHGIHCERLLGL